MEEFITDWKKLTKDSIYEDGAFLNIENSKIMDSIIRYEQEEKDAKRGVMLAIFMVVGFFVVLIPLQVLQGITILTPINYAGFVLMFIGMIFSYFNNRTDNFPDARILPSIEYLNAVQENLQKRRKQHMLNGAILLICYIPGMFFVFMNYFEKGEWSNSLNNMMTFALGILSVVLIRGVVKIQIEYKQKIEALRNKLVEIQEHLSL